MRDETIGSYLAQLAARVPAPGGGAAAALHAAQSAALVAMVARYSNGARYDTELMARIFTEADGLRDQPFGRMATPLPGGMRLAQLAGPSTRPRMPTALTPSRWGGS